MKTMQGDKSSNLDLSRFEQLLSTFLQTTVDTILPAVAARPVCNPEKLVAAIQDLHAKVHRLEAAIELKPVMAGGSDGGTADLIDRIKQLEKLIDAKPRVVDNGKSVAAAIEATMTKVTARLDQLLAHSIVETPRPLEVKEQVESAVETAMSRHMERLERLMATRLPERQEPESSDAGRAEELQSQIEEASEGQRRDFLKLNERFDTMMSQSRSEGARLRTEMAELADSR
ncbi:hypothetical protein PtB15_6B595 [Puccinia triticina]|nr:hypothetical protein PtB15_6B595 [Puccinia triticina]